ncbi:SEC14-like protein 2 [Trichonephila clavipes]|nr:SEC14-like protein 2 [Trichonephila clavipes]
MHDMTPKTLEDESLFYRFCKARDFVLEDAEAMLRKHITWRVQFQVDSILTHYKPPEVVDKYTQFHFIGYDKEASVIRYVDYGNADLKAQLARFDSFLDGVRGYTDSLDTLSARGRSTFTYVH